MSIQFNHAANFKSKTTATTVLNLPRGALCSSSVQLPGGPLTGDKVRRTLVLQYVTQGMPRSLAEVSIGYPTDYLAVLNNIPVPGNIVDDVAINANAARLLAMVTLRHGLSIFNAIFYAFLRPMQLPLLKTALQMRRLGRTRHRNPRIPIPMRATRPSRLAALRAARPPPARGGRHNLQSPHAKTPEVTVAPMLQMLAPFLVHLRRPLRPTLLRPATSRATPYKPVLTLYSAIKHLARLPQPLLRCTPALLVLVKMFTITNPWQPLWLFTFLENSKTPGLVQS